MSEHTPTPWMAASKYSSVSGVPIVGSQGQRIANTALPALSSEFDEMKARAIANAALIVRAVNSHDALVKALRGLLRFCDQATSYEATHPWQFGAYIDAKAALAAFQDAE